MTKKNIQSVRTAETAIQTVANRIPTFEEVYAMPYVQESIRRIIDSNVKQYPILAGCEDDIRQEILIHLNGELSKFNAEQSSLQTFCRMSIQTGMKVFRRACFRQKRLLVRISKPLHDFDDLGGKESRTTEDRRGFEEYAENTVNTEILRRDVQEVIASCPTDLRRIAKRLLDGETVAAIAKSMGMANSTFRDRYLGQLRREFGKLTALSLGAEAQAFTISTWNMKWLGGNVWPLNDTKNTHLYVEEIINTKATILALQEISPSHAKNGIPQCHYLDLIVRRLNKHHHGNWFYVIAVKGQSQRLAFLYDQRQWTLSQFQSITPGKAFGGRMRKPFLGTFLSVTQPGLTLDIIAVHLKAFPDAADKRKLQIEQLAAWLKTHKLAANTIICGDTNIYKDEPDPALSLNACGFVEGGNTDGTAIFQNQLKQRFDRFYLSQSLAVKAVQVKSLKASALGNYKQYAETISDHFPVVLSVE